VHDASPYVCVEWPARLHAVYRKAFSAYCNTANNQHRKIGSTGACVFDKLPYYRCAIFCYIQERMHVRRE
jgi:hypothetical protein